MVNQVTLMGRIVADPELRYTQGGTAVTNFTIAINRGYGDNEKTDFINCVAWQKTAESIAKYTAKGKRILVMGSIQTSSYEYEGKKRTKTEVNVYKAEFIDWANDNREQKQEPAQSNTNDYSDDFQDDLPF